MTCVVGVLAGDGVLLGADSAGVSGWDLTVRKDPKVFELGRYVFGFTSSFRMGQLLQYGFTPPQWSGAGDLFSFMATEFVDAVRERLSAGGFAKKENEVEEGGTFLVGYRGRLFMVENDYQVGEAVASYAAVGSGAQVAIGVMFAMRDGPSDLKEARVRLALEAAEAHNAGVRSPFVFVRGGRKA